MANAALRRDVVVFAPGNPVHWTSRRSSTARQPAAQAGLVERAARGELWARPRRRVGAPPAAIPPGNLQGDRAVPESVIGMSELVIGMSEWGVA